MNLLKRISLACIASSLLFACSTKGGGVDEGVEAMSSSISASSSSIQRLTRDYTAARAMNARIGRGINLGNCLDGPNEGAWGCTIEESYMATIKSAGFQSVRIPVRWSNKVGYDGTIVQSFKDRVREVVQWANAAGLVAIVDVHHFNELTGIEPGYDLAGQIQIFYTMWDQIATLLADIPNDMLVLEVLNEPTERITSPVYNELLVNAIPIIRKTNPNRTIMVGLTSFGKWGGAQTLEIPPNESNVIMTVHYYDPMTFTHQGTNFGTSYPLGATWGTNQDKADMKKFFDRVADSLNILFPSTDGLGIPTNFGEFGVHSNAPMSDRAAWISTVCQALEDRGMSWNYWEFNSGFGAYNNTTGTWHPELISALIR